MDIKLDDGRGQEIGSRICLAGRAFGIEISVDETVTERDPPWRKVWETTGSPKLLVIGHYRMGFEVSPHEENSIVQVFIEYALPAKAPARWLGLLFAGYYAGWCTRRMVDDAIEYFESSASRSPIAPMSDTHRRAT